MNCDEHIASRVDGVETCLRNSFVRIRGTSLSPYKNLSDYRVQSLCTSKIKHSCLIVLSRSFALHFGLLSMPSRNASTYIVPLSHTRYVGPWIKINSPIIYLTTAITENLHSASTSNRYIGREIFPFWSWISHFGLESPILVLNSEFSHLVLKTHNRWMGVHADSAGHVIRNSHCNDVHSR